MTLRFKNAGAYYFSTRNETHDENGRPVRFARDEVPVRSRQIDLRLLSIASITLDLLIFVQVDVVLRHAHDNLPFHPPGIIVQEKLVQDERDPPDCSFVRVGRHPRFVLAFCNGFALLTYNPSREYC